MCKFLMHKIILHFVDEHALTSGQHEPVRREKAFPLPFFRNIESKQGEQLTPAYFG